MARRKKSAQEKLAEAFVLPDTFVAEAEAHLLAEGRPLLRYGKTGYARSLTARDRYNGSYELALNGSTRRAYDLMESLFYDQLTIQQTADGTRFGRVAPPIPLDLPRNNQGKSMVHMVEGPYPGSDYVGVWVTALGLSVLQYMFDYFDVGVRIRLARVRPR